MKNLISSILLILSFTISINAQQTSSQSKIRLGLSYDKTNNEFGVSFQPLKANKRFSTRNKVGIKTFAQNDANMKHTNVTNYYTIQKTYNASSCFLCWLVTGKSTYTAYRPGPDKMVEGQLLEKYDGFYPKVAIPLSQTYYWNTNSNKRLLPIVGFGWGATIVNGVSITSSNRTDQVLDDTRHAEVIRMVETLNIKKNTKMVIGAKVDMGMQYRIGKDYHIAASVQTGFNVNPIKSTIVYTSMKKAYYSVNFSLSKDF